MNRQARRDLSFISNWTSSELEAVRSVVSEILQERGPISRSAMFYFVDRKKFEGNPDLVFLGSSLSVYAALEEFFDNTDDFFYSYVNNGVYVYATARPEEEVRTFKPNNYKTAYLELTQEYQALKSAYLDCPVNMNFPERIGNFKDAYYDLTVKLKAVEEDPELLELPDSFLNAFLGLARRERR